MKTYSASPAAIKAFIAQQVQAAGNLSLAQTGGPTQPNAGGYAKNGEGSIKAPPKEE